jgi:gluconate 2-dehydrogenase subunit 3-like protein
VTARVYLNDHDAAVLAVVVDRLVPPLGAHPGARALGAVDYIDGALGAFATDPPRIWAGGPFSGRYGGDARFSEFTPLTRLEALAWRTRIEGSLGLAEREWNGPVRGWQEIYRDGIDALDGTPPFVECTQAEQELRLAAAPREFRDLVYVHACEACYGPPEYGGNRDLLGWEVIEFPGDVQPRGWTDAEVSGRA